MTLKIVVVAPMPSASVTSANAAKPGRLRRPRAPYRTSCQAVCTEALLARFDWNETLRVLGTDVLRPRSNQAIVRVQLEAVRRPPGHAADREDRRGAHDV